MSLAAPQQFSQRAMARAGALSVVRKLGLTNGLKLCLDAGDEASLPAASGKWLDLSGNGYDFNRGTTSGSDSTDPAINGTAGRRSVGEYLSFDGGDYLTYDSTNEAWMNNLHKDNAIGTLCGWIYWGTLTTFHRVAGNRNGSSDIGFVFGTSSSSGFLSWIASYGGGNANVSTSSLAFTAGVWQFFAASLSEAVGSNGLTLMLNGDYTQHSSTYATPSSSAATRAMQIGAADGTASSTNLPSGSRMAMFMAWEGVALSVEQLRGVYHMTRPRFSV